MSTLSGYTTTYDFWGTCFSQMSLRAISLHLTLDQITGGFLPRPDPSIRLDHNRAIKLAHSEAFASYLIRGAQDDSGKWPVIVPALSLFTSPVAVEFEADPEHSAGEVEFGIVRVEKSSAVQIWDGQHRTLGAYIAVDRMNAELSDLLHNQSKAKAQGDAVKEAEYAERVERAREIRHRLGRIVIPVSIALETDKERIAELFTDVADNAKGINATALARLDHRNAFNRVAATLYDGTDDWATLEGNIDDDNAYVTQGNQYWTTYRDVAAVAQIAWLGYGARWTPNKEQMNLASEESEILANVREFYEILFETYEDIDDVLSGEIEPSELRGGGTRTSLLSSGTTIKALASAFHDLKFGKQWVDTGKRSPERHDGFHPMTRDEIVAAFKELPMESGSKQRLDKFWQNIDGVFAPPWVAPTARANNARAMSMAIVERVRQS